MNPTLPTQDNHYPRFFQQLPANILSNLMVPLATIFSTAFLGHLQEIHYLAGVALAGNLLSFLFLLLVSLRMGTTGLTAQAVGREDREEILLIGLRNSMLALWLGIALIILQYPLQILGLAWINADPDVIAAAINYFNAYIWGSPAILINLVLLGWFLGREKNGTVLLLSFMSSAVNIALDYLLVVQWNYASTGAGISATISQYLILLLGLILVFQEVSWQEVRALAGKIWQPEALKSTFTLNNNIFINNLIFFLAMVIFNYQGVGLGTTTYTENALLLEIVYLNAFLAEGVGFGVETLSGNSTGKGTDEQLAPLVSIAVVTSLLMGIALAGFAILFPNTLFGLFTNHSEVTELVSIYVFWLLPILGLTSIAFVLEAYFLGLTEGETVRNVSLVAFVIGFAPTIFTAYHFHSNHILWLALCLFLAARIVGFGVHLPRTFKTNIEDGHLPTLEDV
ncbi:guanitoxin biosynthesis MATE family efflux transporter GntT [Scytonema sp. NUACC26]|uniref:guanitoxin biosynthesis MATE family efflux transporter GntT n=1 Tax=Scytonema sp. NUACC26 TaxID=3140176 RepID=UPI0034DB9A19